MVFLNERVATLSNLPAAVKKTEYTDVLEPVNMTKRLTYLAVGTLACIRKSHNQAVKLKIN